MREPRKVAGVGRDQIQKKPTVTSAITTVAIQPRRDIGPGNVSRPIARGFMAITIITAMSGAAKTIHHRTPVERLDRVKRGEVQGDAAQRGQGNHRIEGLGLAQ